ncbi:MAG TPA: hypothetical protein VIX85_10355 [Acidimicrobiales bacterium]
MTQRQAAKKACTSVATSVTLEYVERHDDPADKRRVVLRLSDLGRSAAVVIADASAAAEGEATRRIGSGTMLELRSALEGFVDG